ncbi:hypothetical protein [Amycolatopsis sp. NPDC051071]|uniref:hypothetical protein n=1 Tax=Amycolatopsis sp. NPDC051071 TaxID=3154637 RepID=UPI003442C164
MPRAAQRRPSTDAAFTAPVETAELLDRTGIIAASLPKRRRSPENEHEPEPMPVRPPVCAPVVDKDLRPKAVVIHRRTRTWLVGGAGVALLAIGWFAGTFSVPSSVDALPEQPLPAVATQQPVPPQAIAQPAPPAAPVTVYVPVTVKQQAPATAKKNPAKEQVVAMPRAETRPPEQPRSDTGSQDKVTEGFRSMMDPVAASQLAAQLAQGVAGYGAGR